MVWQKDLNKNLGTFDSHSIKGKSENNFSTKNDKKKKQQCRELQKFFIFQQIFLIIKILIPKSSNNKFYSSKIKNKHN